MIEPNRFYSSEEVAREVFGITARTFYLRRRTLVQRDGFPRPISPHGHPRWLGQALIDWAASHCSTETISGRAHLAGANVIELNRRALAIAASGRAR